VADAQLDHHFFQITTPRLGARPSLGGRAAAGVSLQKVANATGLAVQTVQRAFATGPEDTAGN
jgi:hypothetical protein